MSTGTRSRLLAIAAAGVGVGGMSVNGYAIGPIDPPIPHGPVRIELQPVAGGLVSPTGLEQLADGRMLIADQTGAVRLLKNGSLMPTPFLDATGRVNTLVNTTGTPPNGLRPNYDERGLLGLAVDPDFAAVGTPGFGRIFTYTSEGVAGTPTFPVPAGSPSNHHSVISSWRVSATNADQIDPTSRVEIMRFDEPQSNHNGGNMAFGPDRMLYIAVGDGGGANDTPAGHNPTIGNGQDTATYLGKVLRINPNGTGGTGNYGIPAGNPFASGTGGLREIYAHGFRNPFRFDWDNGDLYLSDVGQNNIEELNKVVAGGNYGWRYKEGTFKFNTDGTISTDLSGLPSGLIDPIMQYDHDEGISIIGGFIYRGTALPELTGKYVFGDYSRSFSAPTGRLFYADPTTGEIREFILGLNDRALGLFVKSMGVGIDGEIYVMASPNGGPGGTAASVFRIVPVPEPATLALLVGGIAVVLRRARRN